MTVSIWQHADELDGLTADVAIVGGGICGISAALACERLGATAVLLERHGLAAGASGRNAGYLMRGMAESYAVAARSLGRERARAVWAWSEENLRSLRALGIDGTPGFADRPSCLLALEEDEAAELEASHAMLREDGFESELLAGPSDIDTLWRWARPRLGLVNPADAVCHPVRVARWLAAMLVRTRVATGCEVSAVEPSGSGVTLRTSLGRIRAGRVLVCTNAWAGELLPRMRGVIRPRRGQMLAARADAPFELRYAYYLNRGDEYVRTGPGGELLMGGARSLEPASEAGDHGGVCDDVQRRLEAWLAALVTDRFEVTHRWSGVMGFAPRGLPVLGPMPEDERVWVCAGFTGHGMSLGHLAGLRAAEALLGSRERPVVFDPPADGTRGSEQQDRLEVEEVDVVRRAGLLEEVSGEEA